MPAIKFRTYGGIQPKIDPRNLPEVGAQVARNVFLAETNIVPLKAPLTIQAIAADQQSLYLWRRGGGSEWITWDSDVDVREGPIADDQFNTIFWTDGTTLHKRQWISGAAVVTNDVSMAAPAAPTITKGKLFTESNVTATFQSFNLPLTAYEWDGDLLKLTFHVASNITPTDPTILNQGVRLRVVQPAGSTYTPTNLDDDAADIFEDTIPLINASAENYGTFQVVGIENANYDASIVPASGYSVPYDKIVSVRMNYSRSSTQYQAYVATSVNATTGQESPPSAASDQVKWEPNDTIILTVASGTVRIYRSASGTVDDDWFFVGETTTGSFEDDFPDSALSEVLPLIENPPALMTGLVAMPGGFFMAFNGKDLFKSEPWLPYSWPTKYRSTLHWDIVGLAVSGNDCVVITKGRPYFVSGTHPEIMTESALPIEQAGVSKRGIAFAENVVCYPSPDGLVVISGGDVRLVTKDHYTREQWNALTPTGMIGSVHDGRYIGWLASGAIIFDFREAIGTLTTTNESATGVFNDLLTDNLYLIQSTNITQWRGAATVLTGSWRSKEYQSIRTPIFSTAKIIASSYVNITLNLYADGALVASYPVTNGNAFRVAKFARSELWSIEVVTDDEIHPILIGPSMQSLR